MTDRIVDHPEPMHDYPASMHKKRYQQLVGGFAGKRIVVLGDLMMDEYLWGRATRISPESPVMVVEVDRESRVPGGAANVVNNLLALGASVSVVGVVGDDEAGRALAAALQESGADVAGIVTDSTRPTTRKTRVVAHSQQVMRVDRERTHAIADSAASRLVSRLACETPGADAVLISDYNKGVLTPDVAGAAIATARESSVLLTANPKPANARHLVGADVVSLNQSEADTLTCVGTFSNADGLDSAGSALRGRLQTGALVVTRGAQGLSFWTDRCCQHIAAHPVEVYDVAGAGDTVIGVLTLGIAAGADLREAAVLANHAASCVVRKLGVATVTTRELMADWAKDEEA